MRTAPLLFLALFSLSAAGCMSGQDSTTDATNPTTGSGMAEPGTETGEQNNPTGAAEAAS